MSEVFRIKYGISVTPFEDMNSLCTKEEGFASNLAFNIGTNDGKLIDDKIIDPLIIKDHLSVEASFDSKTITVKANKAPGFFININDTYISVGDSSIIAGTTNFTFRIKDNNILIKATYEKGGYKDFIVPIQGNKFCFDIGREGNVAIKYDVWMSKHNTTIMYENGMLFAKDSKSINGTWLWVKTVSIPCGAPQILMVGKKYITIQILKASISVYDGLKTKATS